MNARVYFWHFASFVLKIFDIFFSEKYSLYTVKVSASTSVGAGENVSSQFRTAEDSKFFYATC